MPPQPIPSSVATGGWGHVLPQPQSGRVTGIAEIRGENGGGMGVPDHLGQRNYSEVRYDMRCYFNVHYKADLSQLNLPHGNDN